MTTSWAVTLTYPIASPTIDQVEGWEDALGDEGEEASVASIPGRAITVTQWIDDDSPVTAVSIAVDRAAKVIPADPYGIEVYEEEIYAERAFAPTVPELMSSVEAGELLGVTRQRVGQLARKHPQFPAPLYVLRTGPLWTRSAIEWFAGQHRRPGRPANRTTVAS